MTKPTVYRQCMLKRHLSDGSCIIDVCYIPNKFAKKGGVLKIKNRHGEFVDGWTVVEVFDAKTDDELETQHEAHKRWEDVLD